jgi:DNA-binding response OmpR family regulator
MLEGLPKSLSHGRLVVEPHAFRAWQDGREVRLTLRQFEVLLYLLMNRHRVVRREELHHFHQLTGVRDGSGDGLRSVDVAILGLRRKLGNDAVETVRGVGYRLPRLYPSRAAPQAPHDRR